MASGNLGKLREIARLLADLDCDIVPQSDFALSEAIEDGDTFTANALIKARHAAKLTSLPAIADDSGLVVDALQGRPGVYSARYAGADASDEDNIDKLLLEMQGVADADRGAAFHCVACFVMPEEDKPLIAEGVWRGRIAHARSGNGGFGYDPIFIVPEFGVSSAELSAEQKNAHSHRGQALAKLALQLKQIE